MGGSSALHRPRGGTDSSPLECAHAHSMTVVAFTVPPGVRAGQQIVVEAPDGQRVPVQLPANTRPGQRMQVNV